MREAYEASKRYVRFLDKGQGGESYASWVRRVDNPRPVSDMIFASTDLAPATSGLTTCNTDDLTDGAASSASTTLPRRFSRRPSQGPDESYVDAPNSPSTP